MSHVKSRRVECDENWPLPAELLCHQCDNLAGRASPINMPPGSFYALFDADKTPRRSSRAANNVPIISSNLLTFK